MFHVARKTVLQRLYIHVNFKSQANIVPYIVKNTSAAIPTLKVCQQRRHLHADHQQRQLEGGEKEEGTGEQRHIHVLGIESTCDETAAAVVRSDRTVLSNVVASQFHLHKQYGGVYPRLAGREHAANIDR
jgi:hypothetical protein